MKVFRETFAGTPRRAVAGVRGFTLIELLVVVAIIVVLIGILIPSLGRSKRGAYKLVCENNLRSLGFGSQFYQNEFDQIIPWGGFAEGDRPIRSVGTWSEGSSWFNAMLYYIGRPTFYASSNQDLAGGTVMPKQGGKGIFVCPLAGEPQGYGFADDTTDGYLMMYGKDDAGNDERRKTYWCYGFNTQLDGGQENRNTPPTYHVWQSMKKMSAPAQTVLLTEKIMRADEQTPPFASNVCQSLVSWREFTTRHDGGGFIVFLDGHVEYYTRTQVYDTMTVMNFNKPGFIVWNPYGPAF